MGSGPDHFLSQGNILWRFNQELESNSALAADNSRKLPVYLVIFGLAQ
jgi:hypothetical protein